MQHITQRFPAILRALRARRGWTVRELGERAGLTHGTISHLETGRYEPRLSTLDALARALNVRPGKFFSENLDSTLDNAG